MSGSTTAVSPAPTTSAAQPANSGGGRAGSGAPSPGRNRVDLDRLLRASDYATGAALVAPRDTPAPGGGIERAPSDNGAAASTASSRVPTLTGRVFANTGIGTGGALPDATHASVRRDQPLPVETARAATPGDIISAAMQLDEVQQVISNVTESVRNSARATWNGESRVTRALAITAAGNMALTTALVGAGMAIATGAVTEVNLPSLHGVRLSLAWDAHGIRSGSITVDLMAFVPDHGADRAAASGERSAPSDASMRQHAELERTGLADYETVDRVITEGLQSEDPAWRNTCAGLRKPSPEHGIIYVLTLDPDPQGEAQRDGHPGTWVYWKMPYPTAQGVAPTEDAERYYAPPGTHVQLSGPYLYLAGAHTMGSSAVRGHIERLTTSVGAYQQRLHAT